MSITTELLKAKQQYITKHKFYPIRLYMLPAYYELLKQEQIFIKKSGGNGTYYMGCYIDITDDLEESFMFSGGGSYIDETNN